MDGDITLDGGDIDVDEDDPNDAFRVYTTGDFGMKNSKAGADWSDGAKYFQIYGTSETLVAIQGGGGTDFVGTVYAPRKEPALTGSEENDASIIDNGKCDGWDVCITTGSSNVKGAIVAGPTKFGQNAGLTYDNALENVEPSLQLQDGVLPPPITFLKVSVHTVNVNNTDARIVPAGGVSASMRVVGPTPTSAIGDSGVGASTGSFVASPARRGVVGGR
jgi:hypothetical protein